MKTVLLVDDEPTLRALIAELLREEGYAVVTAGNGREALASVAQARPDLVLMDVMMPEMDGRAAQAAMRKAERELPIVLMSASHAGADLGTGVDGFLRKPFISRIF